MPLKAEMSIMVFQRKQKVVVFFVFWSFWPILKLIEAAGRCTLPLQVSESHSEGTRALFTYGGDNGARFEIMIADLIICKIWYQHRSEKHLICSSDTESPPVVSILLLKMIEEKETFMS